MACSNNHSRVCNSNRVNFIQHSTGRTGQSSQRRAAFNNSIPTAVCTGAICNRRNNSTSKRVTLSTLCSNSNNSSSSSPTKWCMPSTRAVTAASPLFSSNSNCINPSSSSSTPTTNTRRLHWALRPRQSRQVRQPRFTTQTARRATAVAAAEILLRRSSSQQSQSSRSLRSSSCPLHLRRAPPLSDLEVGRRARPRTGLFPPRSRRR